jgi:iron(III) transport system substrate-binding protein
MVSTSELNAYEQLLDPKWTGKIVTNDPRIAGTASAYYTQVLLVKGEPWLRSLLAQDLAIQNDDRVTVEGIVRGRYPVAIGASVGQLESFRQAGAIPNILPLEPDSALGAFVTTGYGALTLINKAAHPNAAKLFVNWLLSQEGQTAYVKATDLNSRRTDVEGPPDYRPKAGVKYLDTAKEEYSPAKARAAAIAKEVIK